MNAEIIYDVVKKLTGKIEPVGESNTDERHLTNLKTLTDVIQRLVDDVSNNSCWSNNHEHSIQLIVKESNNFLISLKDSIENSILH